MEQNETGCQAPPEAPVLCANNCGFFGSAATMNLCSKCYKDKLLKQEQAKLATASIETLVNGASSSTKKHPDSAIVVHEQINMSSEPASASTPRVSVTPFPNENDESVKQGPKRCGACNKRVGLTGFECRCGNLFCATHRYSDKHECPFDYRAAGRDAIAKANPVVRAKKLEKI